MEVFHELVLPGVMVAVRMADGGAGGDGQGGGGVVKDLGTVCTKKLARKEGANLLWRKCVATMGGFRDNSDNKRTTKSMEQQ